MRAELKNLISSDFDERVFWPEEEDCFVFGMEATIGPEGEDASEIFGFLVCTPKWIATKGINKDFGDFGIFGRNMLIISEYDWERIKQLIAKLCNETTGKNWSDISCKLAKFGKWEFEDYYV